MAYWAGVKETLDREAEELKLERRRQWEALVRSRKSGEGRLV